jgi:DNA-cytosine methyltransferase
LIQLRAIEFFSGIGSFAEACRNTSLNVVAAFDQNGLANNVYEHNFDLRPINATLDSIQARQIPDADIWWLSPPCTPYSVRGRRDDLKDPRAKSLMRLLQLVDVKNPEIIILENVRGFKQSAARELVLETFRRNGYRVFETMMCSTDFGVPMRRPRYFLAGVRLFEKITGSVHLSITPIITATSSSIKSSDSINSLKVITSCNAANSADSITCIKDFLDTSTCDEKLIMDHNEFQKYEAGLNVVSAHDSHAVCICFTKNYYRCKTASGSLLMMDDGRIRRFSSREILRLFGFSSHYKFPPGVTEEQSTAFLGNAVDVRMIKHLLKSIVAPAMRQPLFFSEFSSCK